MPRAAEGRLFCAESVDDAPCFRVPQMHHSVEASREKSAPIVLESDIPNRSRVRVILMQAALAFDVPDAAATIVTRAQQQ